MASDARCPISHIFKLAVAVDGAAAPKGSMTYDSIQGNFLRVSESQTHRGLPQTYRGLPQIPQGPPQTPWGPPQTPQGPPQAQGGDVDSDSQTRRKLPCVES